jgi:heat shock protein HslJ
MRELSFCWIIFIAIYANCGFSQQSQTQGVSRPKYVESDGLWAGDKHPSSLAGVYIATNLRGTEGAKNYFLVLTQNANAVMIIENVRKNTVVRKGSWRSNHDVMITWNEEEGKALTAEMIFELRGNTLVSPGTDRLILERATTAAISNREEAAVVGPIWRWEQTVNNNGKTIKPDADPEKYTIQFLPDGRFAVHKDCNSGSGPYLIRNNQIAIGSMQTTLALCKPGSLERDFADPLESIATYSVDGENSKLELQFNSATITFVKQQ